MTATITGVKNIHQIRTWAFPITIYTQGDSTTVQEHLPIMICTGNLEIKGYQGDALLLEG